VIYNNPVSAGKPIVAAARLNPSSTREEPILSPQPRFWTEQAPACVIFRQARVPPRCWAASFLP